MIMLSSWADQIWAFHGTTGIMPENAWSISIDLLTAYTSKCMLRSERGLLRRRSLQAPLFVSKGDPWHNALLRAAKRVIIPIGWQRRCTCEPEQESLDVMSLLVSPDLRDVPYETCKANWPSAFNCNCYALLCMVNWPQICRHLLERLSPITYVYNHYNSQICSKLNMSEIMVDFKSE